MPEYQEKILTFKTLLRDFNEVKGYYNLNNDELASQLQQMKLLGENYDAVENKIFDEEIIAAYKKWSFTVSFLQMINAWQWFFAGILLGRQSYLTTQVMQMYYYAIFFSYGSFLSAQFKGNYTLTERVKHEKIKNKNIKILEKVRNEILKVLNKNTGDDLLADSVKSTFDNQGVEEIREAVRRDVWFVENKEYGNYIHIKDNRKSGKGEHERRSILFYRVFGSWDSQKWLNISYPDIRSFKDDDKFHSNMRNNLTYSIKMMADELYYDISQIDIGLTNEMIVGLWQRESPDLVKTYPEEFWALEHIKIVVDLHTKLLERYENKSPYTDEQVFLLKNICEHHRNTGLAEVLKVAMPSILKKIGI
ncbi:hypothetical protein [Nostoc sp. GT001]|uniref:hypothetical protein n=1 Tax=Nostoc sp. GT001 TaxID=3056647 RepID=UPI0025AAFE95|nr:hypothetical protein [Nostoc sp. GT001]MDM9583295.1 hypothetical protein [Nostoc sp. GT001]